MEETEARDVSGLVDHLFRHSAGRIVSSLTRVFGPADLELVEDAVQEALEKALKHWPFRGIPENPGGWLFAVARNAALDRVRRRTRQADASDQIVALMEVKLAHMTEPVLSREIADDHLRMMFTCCHPEIPADARVALTLKTIGGFAVREIAHAFLAEEQTIAQRLVRAKRRIREQRIPFAMAEPEMLPARLKSVLDVLYLMFNDGYNAVDGDLVVRRDVCSEALRLVEIVAAHPETGRPETHALAALFCFQAARFPARQGPSGDLLLLSEQDRRSWDSALIERGARHMERAAAGDNLTTFHLEAGVAACHAVAPSFEERQIGAPSSDSTTSWCSCQIRRYLPSTAALRWRWLRVPRLGSLSSTASSTIRRSRATTCCRRHAASSTGAWASRDRPAAVSRTRSGTQNLRRFDGICSNALPGWPLWMKAKIGFATPLSSASDQK